MRSQSALEFMTVVGLGLIILALTSVLGYQNIISYSGDIDAINAKQTINNLISGTKLVYSQGPFAQTQVFITVPGGVIQNRTYLYDGEINYRFERGTLKDVYDRVGIKTYGTLPLLEGKTSVFIRLLPKDIFDFIDMETGAYFYLNDPNYSLILVQTYNDASCNTVSHNITGSTVYYHAAILDMASNFTAAPLEINLYKPDGALYDSISGTASWVECANFTVASDEGQWLLSVKVIPINAVGTTMFYRS